MKLALMPGEIVPRAELRELGFEAMQMFWGSGGDGDDKDPSPEAIDEILKEGDIALAAMTLHVDLVGPQGLVEADVQRLLRCVEKTAALHGRFGDNERPILVWHPSGYPAGDGVDDRAIFYGLCAGLKMACVRAEELGVYIAVEITRAGSIGSAETYLHIKDRVGSEVLRVCIDAANFVPDRTPLLRAVRALGPEIVIAHGKDSSFKDNGEVADYGPTGSGKLDYAEYMRCLRQYAPVPYFVLEYYRSREDLLKARDIVLAGLE
jgi:sugar phosphate isomerase/epimerase